VKVLDFGLAKFDAGETSRSAAALSQSPTLTFGGTQVGVLLGTAAYMSPEQARGRPADRRTDVWAFGCLLYELLAGQSAFQGEDIGETLASVIKSDPQWDALPPDAPPHLGALIRQCLTKDPARRIGSMSIVRYVLDQPAASAAASSPSAPPSQRMVRLWAVAATLLSVAALALLARDYRARSGLVKASRLLILPPDKTMFVTNRRAATAGVISPDGSTIAFTARDEADRVQLYLRPLDSLSATPVAGTDEAAFPFWSPDSRFVGYTAKGRLLEVARSGGVPQTVCECVNTGFGQATWTDDGSVVINIGPGPLVRVPARGGQPTPLTRLGEDQTRHFAPVAIRGTPLVLYFANARSENATGVFVVSLETGASTRLLSATTTAAYDPSSGRLLFVRDGVLFAQRFSPASVKLEGDPIQIADRVENSVLGLASFSVSDTGTLVYGSGTGMTEGQQLMVLDRTGRQVGVAGPPGHYRGMALSPDGKRLAVHRHVTATSQGDVWVIDLDSGGAVRITADDSQENSSPAWERDGQHIVFASNRMGKWGLYRRAADGSGDEERVYEFGARTIQPVTVTADRQVLFYADNGTATRADLDLLTLAPTAHVSPLLHTRFLEPFGQVSPDGRWIAYASDETDRMEVYVQAFPQPSGKRQVSRVGGSYPVWRPDGSELYFLDRQTGGAVTVVSVKATGHSLELGAPEKLFDSKFVNVPHTAPYQAFTAAPDGQRFIVQRPAGSAADQPSGPMVVVLNWSAGRGNE